jgi:hypothetical protein
MYIVVNIACAIINSYDNGCDRSDPSCSPATTPQMFHSLEFGATFVFNTVDVFALSYAPMTLNNQYTSPTLLKVVVLFNVVVSALSFLLVLINLQKFEIPAHELEYANELTIAVFDAIILLSLVKGRPRDEVTKEVTGSNRKAAKRCVLLLGAFCVAALQLGIYNLSGWTKTGQSLGERPAHYLEFFFGIVSAGITFWFTMDNKMVAETRLRAIMYVNARPAAWL